jgi:LuxR family maltose regulon positive regulatory protein
VKDAQSSIAKINSPRLTKVYLRTGLFERLDRARNKPIVWISAPAGSGKTTLIASYLKERKLPALWYQMDEGDGDAATFFYYMGLAVKKAVPRKKSPMPLLTPEYMMGLPTFTRNYFRELFTRLKSPAVLVLDNYQDAPSGSMLHDLLAGGFSEIPEGRQVILLSRHEPPEPYARLRASGAVELLDWEALRLSEAEAAGIGRLKARGGNPNPEALRVMHEKTRGWVAGLVLMLEEGRGGVLPDQGIPADQRKLLFDYFAGELFRKETSATRDFLLKTAHLPKIRLRAAERLTGQSGSQRILEDLTRRNFFTVRHEGTPPAYEYHPLFREFLIAQSEGKWDSHELHSVRHAAGRLLEQSGQVEEAAELYHKTADWGSLSGLILGHAESLMIQGRVTTLQRWMAALPPDELGRDPWLCFWMGSSSVFFDPSEGRRCFERAYRGFLSNQDETGMVLAWSGAAESAFFAYDDLRILDPWIDRLDEMFEGEPRYPSVQVESRFVGAVIGAMIYRRPDHPNLPRWVERAESILSRSSEGLPVELVSTLSLFYIWTGEYAKIRMMIDRVESVTQTGQSRGLGGPYLYVTKAVAAWITADWDICDKTIWEAMEESERTGVHLFDTMILAQGVYRHASCGQIEKATEYLDRMKPLVGPARPLDLTHYHYLAAWVALITGDYARASEEFKASLSMVVQQGTPFPEGLHRILMAQLEFHQGRKAEAIMHLARLDEIISSTGFHNLRSHGLNVRADIAFQEGSEKEGIEALRRGFQIGRALGLVNFGGWEPGLMSRVCVKALEHDIEPDYARMLIRKRNLVPEEPPVHLLNWPWSVKVKTLGRFHLERDGEAVAFSGKAQKKPLEMLKCLIALGGKEVAEEELAEALWPDSDGDTAHRACQTTLHRLRKLVGHKEAITQAEGRVNLDPRYCWVDGWAFERMAAGANDGGSAKTKEERAERALDLYGGSFLQKETDAPWALSMRERLRMKYLQLIRTLGERWESSGDWERAVSGYERGVEADPAAEEFYQRLMSAYSRLGRRADAASAYRRCRRALAAHLDVEPSQKTEALYRDLSQAS